MDYFSQGFGFSALIFDQIDTRFVNPEDIKPSLKDGQQYYFSPDDPVQMALLDKVPQLFKLLSYIYTVLYLIGIYLIRNPEGFHYENESSYSESLVLKSYQLETALRSTVFATTRACPPSLLIRRLGLSYV